VILSQTISTAFGNAVFNQAIRATFSDATFQQTISTAFGNAVFDQAIRATFSDAAFQQTISTAFGNAVFDQAIRATFSDAAFQQTISTAFGDAVFDQAIRATFGYDRLGGGGEYVSGQYRESEAENELAFHDGVLRGVVGWCGAIVTPGNHQENFIGMMVNIDGSDSSFAYCSVSVIGSGARRPPGGTSTDLWVLPG
jgi:hypothetical protein